MHQVFFISMKFVNDLSFEVFITNPDSFQSKCDNYAFVNRHHKHIVIVDLRIRKIIFEDNILLQDRNVEKLGL